MFFYRSQRQQDQSQSQKGMASSEKVDIFSPQVLGLLTTRVGVPTATGGTEAYISVAGSFEKSRLRILMKAAESADKRVTEQKTSKIMKELRLIIVAMMLVGCATKQYPQAPAVTTEETTAFDCKAVEQEIVKAHSVQSEISETGRFDVLTVLGFIGDFGLGNGLAKHSATKKADVRLNQLESLKTTKCLPAVA